MERNTLENKAKFFAQYFEQKVLANTQGTHHPIIELTKSWNWKHSDFYLELKPLSQINDEDAIEVAKIFQWNHLHDTSKIHSVKEVLTTVAFYRQTNINGSNWLEVFDYLRSKGYALSWNGITVEEMIEWKWIQLKS